MSVSHVLDNILRLFYFALNNLTQIKYILCVCIISIVSHYLLIYVKILSLCTISRCSYLCICTISPNDKIRMMIALLQQANFLLLNYKQRSVDITVKIVALFFRYEYPTVYL